MKTPCPIDAREAGFTLVEVVIATAIFAIGILAVGAMHVTSLRTTGSTSENTEASALAAERVEALMRHAKERGTGYYGYQDAPELDDTDGDDAAGLFDDTSATADHVQNAGRYTIFWNVAEDQLIEGTKTIRIVVVWTGRGGDRRYSVEYIAADII